MDVLSKDSTKPSEQDSTLLVRQLETRYIELLEKRIADLEALLSKEDKEVTKLVHSKLANTNMRLGWSYQETKEGSKTGSHLER
jgi:hypothetical protein